MSLTSSYDVERTQILVLEGMSDSAKNGKLK